MADDDTKNLNNADDSVKETVDTASTDDTQVDISPVGADELSTEDEALTPTQEAEVEAENAQTAEDLDEADQPASQRGELASESANQSDSEEADDNEPSTTNDQPTDEPAEEVNPNARWYVVHTYSGHENRVATNLRQRIESEHLEHKIVDILVPTQDKIEIRGGKKEQVKEKVFPGYILVKMELDNLAWIAVRTTQGVIGFVGAGTKPMPISEAEVKSIVQFMNQGASPTFKEVFLVDDTVKIIDGPFADFIGKVESVDKEKGKLRVLVSIFGRETPVELDFLQVSKL